ncbi:sensor histidine kinase [Aestuariibacter salexigens]|uniref:sensor histidine kinase n=1 Tax=Aestuariibacter salexigens TaxID=226010 RepID=UPI0004294CB9|nr:HAMP domain-containing sensor histidine kinase [Aestuariibacter salexigens]
MYKRKLFYFGLTTAFILIVALLCTAISAHLTRQNLRQSTIAQSLLIEHQELSSISYRMFKQLTDEVIFGQNANQTEVRKKQELIAQALTNIRRLEIEQREALGEEITQGSVEDTDELEQLIEQIVLEFNMVVRNRDTPADQRARLEKLLEVTIDNKFREAINAAVLRQGKVVAAINAKIDTLNTAIVWFTLGLAILSLPLIAYGCYWLFNQLYQPLVLIRNATDSILSGHYRKPISETLDDEFDELADSINTLAEQLQDFKEQEAMSRKNLEVEVEQRTRELTNANLQLTKIDSRRRQFIADVSHELRTPLTIIRGEAQVTLRLKSACEEDYKETLSSILNQSVTLSRLVDDLLLLTRAEMNQLQLELASVAMQPLLQTEVSKWQRLHTERQITVSADDDTVTVKIDTPRIQQVLSILIDNAVKYSAPGMPVNVSLTSDSSYAKVTVKDCGDGISAAEIENVFERFVRFRKHNDGLGLGLPIAKAIVEAHGGSIVATSVPGEGSTFSFSLPLEPQS